MGKIGIPGGAGGVTSDDVTASKAQVLQGYKTVTTDSDDEVVDGQIKSVDCAANDYSYNRSNSFGIDTGHGTFWIELPHRNAYYWRADNRPHTEITASALGNAAAEQVLGGVTFTSKNGVAIGGSIPRWVCTTGNVISAGGDGSAWAWDDVYAGRGRGVICSIPNGWYIENTGYIFLPSPNLYSQNVVKGVNINNVIGTRDWVDVPSDRTIAGDVVFNVSTSEQQSMLHYHRINFASYEALLLGVDQVGIDISRGRRYDKGNGRYHIADIAVIRADVPFWVNTADGLIAQFVVRRENNGLLIFYQGNKNSTITLNIYCHAYSSAIIQDYS